tara:strand:+ start:69 stop:218 length:150 start_codon:yes stop_codon:yes gene_type:complete
MFAPLGETQPAEAMMALLTSYVHAALILLNKRGALRASFAICFQPSGIF